MSPTSWQAVVFAIGAIGIHSGFVAAQTPSFSLLGHASGTDGSRAAGVSANGSVVTGWSGLGIQTPGFTWTRAAGRNDFGLEPGLPSQTFG